VVQPVNEGGACSDGNACTSGDQCAGGQCQGSPVVCNDSNPCTDDSCNPGTGCVYTPDNTNTCSDADACTRDACVNGACVSTAGAFASTSANQNAGPIYLLHRNVYAAPPFGSASQITQFGPTFLPSGMGLDAVDVQADGNILFSTDVNGWVNHTGTQTYVRHQNVYHLNVATGLITELVNWSALGIGLQELDALDRLDQNRYAISSSTNHWVGHAGGQVYVSHNSLYEVNVATRTVTSAPLLTVPSGLGLDAADVLPGGGVAFSTDSNGWLGSVYVQQDNAYIRQPNGTVVLGVNGQGLQLLSFDALTLGPCE
jgi:hypothetical protein